METDTKIFSFFGVPVKANKFSGWLKLDNELDRVIFTRKGQQYILNNLKEESPIVEAWDNKGNYQLISKSEIDGATYRKFEGF